MKKWLGLGTLALVIGGGLYYHKPQAKSPNKDMLAFSINGADATINQTSGEMDVILPTGTSLSSLAPVFTTDGISVTVYKLKQYSGQTTQDFESNVPYVVTAANNTQKQYFAHVTTSSLESATDIQYFAINSNTNGGLSFGSIDNDTSTIDVLVPSNTNLTSLPSYFTYIGSSIQVGGVKQISNITTNNFTSPVTYSIVAKDGTPSNYTVNVSKAAASAKDITRFNLITGYGTFPCQIISTNINCGVPSQVGINHLIADWSSTGSSVKVGTTSQISGLSVNNFESPVVYTVTSGDGNTTKAYTVNVSNYMTFLNVQNLAENIFDNTTYNVSFNVLNNESNPIVNIEDDVSINSPFVWNQTSDTCNGNTLGVSESCVVTGTLNVPKSYGQSVVHFYVKDNDGILHADFNKIVTAIPKITELNPSESESAKYAAYVFTNAGAHRIFATAVVNGNNIQFDNKDIGAFTNQTESYGSYAVELVKGKNTLYIPAYPGVGGKVLISVDKRLPDGPTPSVTATVPADTYYTRWQQVEYGGGLDGSSNPALFNLNPTNVDFISIPVSISTVISGDVGPFSTNSFVRQGILYSDYVTTQPVFDVIESGLVNVPDSPVPSWGGLPQQNSTSDGILRVLSPSSIFPFMNDPTNQFYFDGSAYTQYINDLWDYYTDNIGGNYLYVDDSPVAAIVNPGAHCILQCQVSHIDNVMHCITYSGNCQATQDTGTVDGEYDLPGGSSPAGFTKFTPEDFVGAAGANTMTTFGLNGTYRSITGENIVSGQSVGFFPYCGNESYVYGNPSYSANESQFYQPQYSCLTNYNTYKTAIIDQYSAQSSLYFFYYNYGYSDTLGQSGAIYNLNNQLYPFTIDVNYQ